MSQQVIGIAKEEPPTWAKFLRLVVEKRKLPTAVNFYEHEGHPPGVEHQARIYVLTTKDSRGRWRWNIAGIFSQQADFDRRRVSCV
jgi:hypothetical protein